VGIGAVELGRGAAHELGHFVAGSLLGEHEAGEAVPQRVRRWAREGMRDLGGALRDRAESSASYGRLPFVAPPAAPTGVRPRLAVWAGEDEAAAASGRSPASGAMSGSER
jgi:hypothetical protein